MNSKVYKILDLVTIGIGVRPKALITPDKNLLQDKNKGGIVISADFELAWACRFSKKEDLAECGIGILRCLKKKKSFPDSRKKIGINSESAPLP